MADERPHIRIYKWDELQHYKDREPPWIKLYNRLLDHYEFGRLPDAVKGHYMGLLMLRSRHGERLPLDVDWLASRINATQRLDLRPLVNAGLIELYHADSASIAQDDSTPQSFARSREAEAEERQRQSSGDSLPTVEKSPGEDAAVENSRESENKWGPTVTACQEHVWLADDPPRGRSRGEEISVAKQLEGRWNADPDEIALACEGFGRLRDRGFFEGWIEPGEPACLLAVNRTPEDENGIPVYVRSLHEMRKNGAPQERGSEPERVRA